jgi:putative nucleotidyltransferase with HDIG domain/PAS domain S-box-containing protein
VNSSFAQFAGKSKKLILGKTSQEMFPPDISASMDAADKKVLVEKKPFRIESHIVIDHLDTWHDTIKAPVLDKHDSVQGVVGISRDITDKKWLEIELENRYKQLQKAWKQTVEILSYAIEIKDPYTAGHQKRVAALSVAIAKEIDIKPSEILGMEMAAMIHDIGKLQVPSEILSKPGKLMEHEFALIKTHAEVGYSILKGAEFPWDISKMIYQHHERIDGSGYPQGIHGNEIMLEARIIAVADVVEAMASYRPYRPALGIEAALNEIAKYSGTLFDTDVVAACQKLFAEGKFAFGVA